MNIRTAGVAAAATGAVAQMAGLAIDAYLHSADPTLAAREGLFTLSNGGHVLLIAGLFLVVAGVALATVGPRLYDRRPGTAPAADPLRLRVLRVGAPVALVGMFVGGSVLASASSLGEGHDHEVAAGADGGHDHADGDDHADGEAHGDKAGSAAEAPEGGVDLSKLEPEARQLASEVLAAEQGADHGHGDGTVIPNVALDDATRDRLAAELVTAREVALRYPTVADAEAAGYRMITPYLPLIGAHYIKFDLMDGTFDLNAPEMLLYDGTAPDAEIVGLSYYSYSGTEPAGFAGPNDHWHQHIGLCIHATRLVVVGGEDTTEEECRARGGVKSDGTNGWMVHAWVVPGWESPQGVFSAENADLL